MDDKDINIKLTRVLYTSILAINCCLKVAAMMWKEQVKY
jgi:hypothetical protein